MDLTERTLESRTIFHGRILHVVEDRVALPNGHEAGREVVRHPGGVCVLPLHPDGTVTLVRQYRYPYAEVVTELPAGKLEPGEDPDEAVRRELSEETGFTAQRWDSLGAIYPSPGYCDEVLRLYLARDLIPGDIHPDEDEFLAHLRLPLDELVRQVMDGAIRDAKTAVLALKVRKLLDDEEKRCAHG